MYFKGEPLYPFGYGLSYTTFKYSDFRTNSDRLKTNGEILVSVVLKNTGKHSGDEVVQLYIKHLNSKVERPNKELKGFSRVTLKPGESRKVEISLKASDLAYWDHTRGSFLVEPDKVRLMVGATSADIKLEKVIEVVQGD